MDWFKGTSTGTLQYIGVGGVGCDFSWFHVRYDAKGRHVFLSPMP
jgi:hypothetical protein